MPPRRNRRRRVNAAVGASHALIAGRKYRSKAGSSGFEPTQELIMKRELKLKEGYRTALKARPMFNVVDIVSMILDSDPALLYVGDKFAAFARNALRFLLENAAPISKNMMNTEPPDSHFLMLQVIQVHWLHQARLWITFVLQVASVLILVFGSLSFWWYEAQIQVYNDCKTAYQCVMKGFEAGLHGDYGGLHGDSWWNIFQSFPRAIQDDGIKQSQWWFVTLFLLLWNYILVGIVQGYIVDAFSVIREAETQRDDDSAKNCLVCSLDKFTIQDVGQDFKTHVEECHNRWAYVYLATAVYIKPKEYFGTTESVVDNALETMSTDFLPLHTCVGHEGD